MSASKWRHHLGTIIAGLPNQSVAGSISPDFLRRYCWRHGITPRHTDIVPDPAFLEAAEVGRSGEDQQDTMGGGLTLMSRGLRMSLTFRKTMSGQCECDYPRHCNRPRWGYFSFLFLNKFIWFKWNLIFIMTIDTVVTSSWRTYWRPLRGEAKRKKNNKHYLNSQRDFLVYRYLKYRYEKSAIGFACQFYCKNFLLR